MPTSRDSGSGRLSTVALVELLNRPSTMPANPLEGHPDNPHRDVLSAALLQVKAALIDVRVREWLRTPGNSRTQLTPAIMAQLVGQLADQFDVGAYVNVLHDIIAAHTVWQASDERGFIAVTVWPPRPTVAEAALQVEQACRVADTRHTWRCAEKKEEERGRRGRR